MDNNYLQNADKYRIFVTASYGTFFAVESTTVNDLIQKLNAWMNEGEGKRMTDKEARSVELQALDANGNVIGADEMRANSRKDIVTRAHDLGAR